MDAIYNAKIAVSKFYKLSRNTNIFESLETFIHITGENLLYIVIPYEYICNLHYWIWGQKHHSIK